MQDNTPIMTDRFYTREHEWAKTEANEVLVGITAFAVDQLGDVTLVDVTVALGDAVTRAQVFGTVESVKTLSDLFSPITGKVTRINQELLSHPEWLNEDCWNKAWIVAIEPEQPLTGGDELLDATQYRNHVETSQH